MSHEAQALIPQKRGLSCLQIYDALNKNFINSLNMLGAINGSVATYYSITCKGCDDIQCLSNSNRAGLYGGISAAYALCFFNLTEILLKKFYPTNIYYWENINSVINKFIQILNYYVFYTLASSAIASAIAHSCTIPDWQFWAFVFSSASILSGMSALSRTPAKLNKILGMFIAFLEGGSTMISTISGISQIHDAIRKLNYSSPSSWVYSTAGMATRYSIGGAWGFFQTGLKYYYPSYVNEDEIVKSRWPSILQSLLGTITIILLTGFAISNTSFFDLAIMSALCIGIVLFSAIITGKEIQATLSKNFNVDHRNDIADQENFPTTGPIVVEIAEENSTSADEGLALPAPQKDTISKSEETQNTIQQDQNITTQKYNIKNYLYQKTNHILNSILFYKSSPDNINLPDKHIQPKVKKNISGKNPYVSNYARNH